MLCLTQRQARLVPNPQASRLSTWGGSSLTRTSAGAIRPPKKAASADGGGAGETPAAHVAASMSLSCGSSSGLACRIVVTTPG